MNRFILDPKQLQQILDKFNLGQVISCEEVQAGLINPVYLINQKYILRIEQHTFEANPDKLKRESILFQILPQFEIPTPRLIGFDDSLEILNTPYILINFIPGQNLEQAFHSFSTDQQRNISYQLGDLVRKIHAVTPGDIHNPLFGTIDEWVAKSTKDFDTYWAIVNNTEYLPDHIKQDIISNYEKYKCIEWNDKGRLAHGDFTAGNIQVTNGKIVGVFDFEFAFIADPLWDIQKLSSHFQLGDGFSFDEFLRGYSKPEFNKEEKVRIKMHSYQQGLWEIWANLTHFMPSTEKDILEGIEIITSTFECPLFRQ